MPRRATPLTSQTRRKVVEQVAPRYRQASFAQKSLLLDTVVAATGYARKYAIGLLNHASERTQPIQHPHLSHYSTEVQNALLLAWKVTNWICAKRLIPFLPTLIDAMERHEHLHLTQESRNHLLQVSPATAERFLHAQRQSAPHGLSTTKAGTLLKHQIPIRTFEQWDETRPGFLEADLVAHCGGQSQGNSLYTFTLTDIATGWTECLPLLYRSPEAAQTALMRARTLFPFPILGIDTDNGKEFINETILAYCEREHLTFTRGRPECKNDQCFIEQKNGAVVRQFVGYDRFVGEQAYLQLHELYRALRLYVNCFQPSMKLQSKYHDGERMRRVYDPAKTPLQRLVLSGILSAEKQHELNEIFQALDPLGLFEQVEQLQQAFLRNTVSSFSSPLNTLVPPLLRFSSEQCFKGSWPTHAPETASPPPSGFDSLRQERLSQRNSLDWPRTTRDPFEGEWEQILACVLAHPEYSSGDLFQELQQQSPERYHPSQLGTLQRGVRKIRAHLLHLMEEPWPPEVIQAGSLDPTESKPDQREREADPPANALSSPSADPPQEHVDQRSLPHQPSTEEATPTSTIPPPNTCTEQRMEKGCQASLPSGVSLPVLEPRNPASPTPNDDDRASHCVLPSGADGAWTPSQNAGMASDRVEGVAAVSGERTPFRLPQPDHRGRGAWLGGVPAHPLFDHRNPKKGQHDRDLWALGPRLLSLGSAQGISGADASGTWHPP